MRTEMASDVALLGTGRMGAAMARSLARKGFTLILYNRSRDKAATLARELGARVASTPAEAVRAAPVAISMVSDESAIEALYRGADGVLGGVGEGTVLLEMSTVPPSVVQRLDADVRAAGGSIMDAPVSGSVALAESGSLTIMVGGLADDLERVRPILEGISSRIFHMGGLGTGATIKLAVNAIIFSLNQAVAESLVLAERAGVDRSRVYDVFEASAIGAPYVTYKRSAFVEPETTPVAFSLELAAKDLGLIVDLARRVGANIPQTDVNLSTIVAAATSSGPLSDLSAVADYLRGWSGERWTIDPSAESDGSHEPAAPDDAA